MVDNALAVLTQAEITKLDALEAKIQAGLDTFIEVGAALAEIRHSRLYRQDFETFEDYCNNRWGFSRRRANQLISASEIVTSLGTTVPKEIPAPVNEAQARPLQALAEERRAEAWSLAVATAPGGVVTQRHVESVVDQMLGKTGRFEKKLYYPVYDHTRSIYNLTADKQHDLYMDKRFEGMNFLTGDQLNSNKKYEAYSLVAVPDIDVPDFQTTISAPERSYADYPVDRSARIIYLDPRDRNKPKNLYAGCQWISLWSLRSGWNSIINTFGSYTVLPAKEFDKSWVEVSAFQPGMKAICPECAKYTYRTSEHPYEKWQVNDVLLWSCPSGDVIADADMRIQQALPEMPGEPAEDDDDFDSEADDVDDDDMADFDDEAPDSDYILSWLGTLSELLMAIKEYPNVVRSAIRPDFVTAYTSKPYNDPIIPEALAFVEAQLPPEDAGQEITTEAEAIDESEE